MKRNFELVILKSTSIRKSDDLVTFWFGAFVQIGPIHAVYYKELASPHHCVVVWGVGCCITAHSYIGLS